MYEAERSALLRRTLLLIAAGGVCVDVAWIAAGDFQIEYVAYLGIGGLAAALYLGSWFYGSIRPQEPLRAMLFGTAFLCVFSAAFSVLNYLLLTVAGDLIDPQLADIDLMFGIHWPSLIETAAAYPLAVDVLQVAYISILPQIAVLVVCLGLFGRSQAIYTFCLAMALAAGVTIAFWTAFPSFGAFVVYDLDPSISRKIALAVDRSYVEELVRSLREGPGRIAPDQIKGLIAFPSFHAVLAVLIAWYARDIRGLNVVAGSICALVLVATPVHGGHFVVDVAAGALVAVGAALAADRIAAARGRPARGSRPVSTEQPADSPGSFFPSRS